MKLGVILMRKVVDSNFLASDMLRAYLSKSTRNYVVLTDYAAMEAYKGNTLASIYPSMEILAQFPKQVIVLKNTLVVCGLKGRRAGLQKRLIDADQTKDFSTFCKALIRAKNGDSFIEKQLLENGREADLQMGRMLADAVRMPAIVEEVSKIFTEKELKIIRSGNCMPESYTPELRTKIVGGVLQLASQMFKDHPKTGKFPERREITNIFIFRVALCAYILALRYISKGNPIKPEKILNDLVDINFAAFATYFDGILTEDKKLNGIYQAAVAWLRL